MIVSTKEIHWIGAGLSTGTGLKRIVKQAKHTYLWNRTLENAEKLIQNLGISSKITIKKYSLKNLAEHLKEGDILVCMLATNLHLAILKLCLAKMVHFVSSSYQSITTQNLAADAKKLGLVVQIESGLDPGIDHLFAHKLINQCQKETNNISLKIQLESYCGGFPQKPNNFCYKFSWAPLGVLTALQNSALHIEKGQIIYTPAAWRAASSYFVLQEELESYPNRNSLIYQQQYNIPSHWEVDKLIRGTLRPKGWKKAWKKIFAILEKGQKEEITKLANELAKKYHYETGDLDRVLLFVKLTAYHKQLTKKVWNKTMILDLVGDNYNSAMAKTVSETLACAIEDLLENKISAGLHLATKKRSAKWLTKLVDNGIPILEI